MGRDGRTTAVVAAVMATVLGGVELLAAVVAAVMLTGDETLDPGGVAVIVALVVTAVLLLAGAVMVLRRAPVSRLLLGAGAAVTVLGTVLGLVAASRLAVDPSRTWETDSAAMPGVWVIGCLLVAWAVSMLAVALLPSTRRWCQPAADVDYTAAARRLEQRVRGL